MYGPRMKFARSDNVSSEIDMENPMQTLVADSDVYALTRKGEVQLRGAKTTLPPLART